MRSFSLVVGAVGAVSCFLRRAFMPLMTRKIAKATIVKSTMVLMNAPYLRTTAGV